VFGEWAVVRDWGRIGSPGRERESWGQRGGQWMRGRYVPSLLAAIGEVIETHMIDIGFLPLPEAAGAPSPEPARKVVGFGNDPRFRQCPKCGSPSLIRQEDCDMCAGCGYSKCG
jgi:ribonucleoside-diphosphate reductase alpha chain